MNRESKGLLKAHEDTLEKEGKALPINYIRAIGAKNFAQKGLPHPKENAWKHTSLKLLKNNYRWAEIKHPLSAPPLSLLPKRVVFFNGQLCDSFTELEEGCLLNTMAEEETLKQITPRLKGQDCFMGLALAYYQEAYKLEVTEKCSSPLGIYHFFDQNFEATMGHPLLSIEAAKGAQCHLFELTYSKHCFSSAFHNSHTLLNLDKESKVEHVRIFKTMGGMLPFSQVLSEVSEGASYHNTTLALGGNFLRNNIQVKLLEETASTILNGLYAHRNKEDSSHFSLIQHQAPPNLFTSTL